MLIFMRLTTLGQEIDRLLKRKRMSQHQLGDLSGVGQSTISKFMRGVTEPTPATLGAIARVLQVDPDHLMRLAGMPVGAPAADLDPSALYIARRISELPPETREKALDAVGAVVDSIYAVTEEQRNAHLLDDDEVGTDPERMTKRELLEFTLELVRQRQIARGERPTDA